MFNATDKNVTDSYCDATFSVLRATRIVACSLLLLFTCIGNLLVLATVYRYCNMRNTVNYFIANLSISDMVIVLFGEPFQLNVILTESKWLVEGVTGSVLCKFVTFLQMVSLTVSILTVVLIAIDRFLNLVFPYKPARINKRTCLKLIICIWVLAGCSSSFQLFTFRLVRHDATSYCVYKGALNTSAYFENMESYEIDNIVVFVFLTAIPLCLLVVMYTCIVFALNCQSTGLQLAPDAVRQRAKENRNVTFLSLTIVAVFAAAWVPLWAFYFAKQYKGIDVNSCAVKALWYLALFIPFTHCAINPILYYKFNDKYRQGFRKLIRLTLSYLFCRSV